MNDDFGLFADLVAGDHGRDDEHRGAPGKAGRAARGSRSGRGAGRAPDGAQDTSQRARRRRRIVLVALGVVVLVIVVGGGWYGAREVLGVVNYKDYTGSGESDLVAEVKSGDSVGVIGSRLLDSGVVASVRAFTSAAHSDSRSNNIQPGFYVMKTKMSGKAALAKIVEPQSRVGQLEINSGRQLNDVTGTDGKVTPGIIALMAKASCADLNGKSTCVSVDQMRTTVETADLVAIGVPDWAIPYASKAEPRRRLEGLIAPGEYDVRPGSDATEILKTVVLASAKRLKASNMPAITADVGFSPYQVLIVASLVEREAITSDFGKVARVTYNRLAAAPPDPVQLQYDSTVNYYLDRPNLHPPDQELARSTPYNTYVIVGLPPTPIAAPSTSAIIAASKPDPGDWKYFVKCDTNGASCFSATYEQHLAALDGAHKRGVF